MKKCSRADCPYNGQLQPLSNFSKREKGRYRAACRSCVRKHRKGTLQRQTTTKKYYENNKEMFKEYQRTNKRDIRIKEKMRQYGISYELASMFYDKLIRCAICKNGNAIPDHCHTTGRYRAPLCMSCNTLVGFLEKRSEEGTDIDTLLSNIGKYMQHIQTLKG